ncbi:MAG: hypothetical protein MUC36_06285 [Planctomycetes bacterium]|jgi:hypothetical protein|nr:hypothetical protein [Planctomycetota bacterium]
MVARNRLRQGHRPEPGRRPAARTNGSNGAAPTHAAPRAWRTLGIRLPRLYAHCRRLGAIQIDRLRLVAADASLRLMAGSLLVLTTAAVTTIAVTLLLLGVTGGLSELLAGRLWLAALLVGIGALTTTGVALWSGLRWRSRHRLASLRRRHEPQPAATPAAAPVTAGTGSHDDS